MTQFLDTLQFLNFWSSTYPSTNLLSNVIGKSPLSFLPGHQLQFNANDFAHSFINQPLSAISMFHTGYLTIDSISFIDNVRYYNLIPPNKEVEGDYFNTLSDVLLSKQGKDKADEAVIFRTAVITGDAPTLESIIFAFFDGLTHEHQENSESFYHSVFWAYCYGLFKTTKMEEPGSLGDLDVVVELGNNVYAIIEVKYGHPEVTELEIVAENVTDSAADDKKTEGIQETKQKAKAIGPTKRLTQALKKDVNVDKKLNTLALTALDVITEKRYGRKYRVPGNTVIDIGLGVYWRGQVKIAFRNPLY
jgi:hypothetical protein